MQSDDILDVMMPGLPESVDAWVAAYYDLYVTRPPATSPGDRHARHLEEAGLLGRAFTIMTRIQEARHATRPAPAFYPASPLEREALAATGPYDPFRPVTHGGADDSNGAAKQP